MDKIEAREAMKVFYYLMSVDGKVTDEEEAIFYEIGKKIDENSFDDYKNEIIKECKQQMEKAIDQEDFYDVIQEGVDSELTQKNLMYGWFWQGTISAQWLVWDMITIAFSDNDYSDNERKLIKFVVRKLNVDNNCFLEMENLMKSAKAVEQEREWIKTTDKSYKEIQKIVDELELREQTILNSVKILIQD